MSRRSCERCEDEQYRDEDENALSCVLNSFAPRTRLQLGVSHECPLLHRYGIVVHGATHRNEGAPLPFAHA